MKKLTVWALLLALTVSMLAGCTNTPAETTAPATNPVETQPATEAVSGLADAVAYVKTIYKNAADITAKDYEVISVVPMGAEKFEITWTVDVAEDVVAVVAGENGMTLIDVNENSAEEVPYVLTASLTDGKETQTLSWNHTLPAAMNVDGLTYAEIVAMAYALEDQQATEDTYRLFGTVSSIDTEWSEDYQNITVTIVVAGCEDFPIQCYRLKGEGAKDLAVGQTITVAGIIKNYKGLIEFDKGCKLVPNDAYHSVKNALSAYKLEDGAAQEAAKTITGTVVSIDSAWSDEYQNITVTIVVAGLEDYPIQCYRLAGEGAKDLAEGSVVTVTGILKNYKGTYEFDKGCTLDAVQ